MCLLTQYHVGYIDFRLKSYILYYVISLINVIFPIIFVAIVCREERSSCI